MPIKYFLLLMFFAQSGYAQMVTMNTFNSPSGLSETCATVPPIPGGEYSKGDFEDEEFLCSLDFYGSSPIALCPKTWSTSPATMIYDISESGLSQQAYEKQSQCGGDKEGHDKLAKFKQSMNQKGTSGTYSVASLVYYHFSRYLDTSVKVPVAVYRTIDKDTHFKRVTQKAHEKKLGKGSQIRAGWMWMYDSLRNPSAYKPGSHLFTDNNRQIFGVLIDDGGERYGPEINGVRSGWGKKDNLDFQNTAPFLALRSEKPLLEAIQEGLALSQKDRTIKAAMGGGASDFQMAVWMKELTEIVILDFIFSQQDRVGNIDYRWYYYWVNAKGKVKDKKLDTRVPRSKMATIEYPKEVDGSPTYLVQRSRINDNDAGVLVRYANFAKQTEMLEKLRHLDPDTYERLADLNDDLQSQGRIYQSLGRDFGLAESEVSQIVKNTALAYSILSKTVEQGKMQFDLQGTKKTLLKLSQ